MHHYSYIHINGYPGIGELAVADALAKLIPRAKVFHNHLTIDSVAALVDRGGPEYPAIRAGLRRHILDVLATAEATRGLAWIFTDSRSTSPVDAAAAQYYRLAAKRCGEWPCGLRGCWDCCSVARPRS
jgi:hypothetical protein